MRALDHHATKSAPDTTPNHCTRNHTGYGGISRCGPMASLWLPHAAGWCRVPSTSPLAPHAAVAFPMLYCDKAAPDAPYHLVPTEWIAWVMWPAVYAPP